MKGLEIRGYNLHLQRQEKHQVQTDQISTAMLWRWNLKLNSDIRTTKLNLCLWSGVLSRRKYYYLHLKG